MSKTQILVVDDEPAIVDVLVYNLSKEGFEITSASDGREAIQKCQASPPDLMILDLMLPHIDGFAGLSPAEKRSANAEHPHPDAHRQGR
jgi:DNA-binding response OmpR family regulator